MFITPFILGVAFGGFLTLVGLWLYALSAFVEDEQSPETMERAMAIGHAEIENDGADVSAQQFGGVWFVGQSSVVSVQPKSLPPLPNQIGYFHTGDQRANLERP